jgi:lysophospholipase L1-like esterase
VPKTTVWKSGGSWPETHAAYVERAKRGHVNLVFFGDSITQWWPWQDFKKRYEPLGAVNFGIGGDKTQNLLWRIENGEMEGIAPKLAIVLIGTNNMDGQLHLVPEAIGKIVTAIRTKSPTTRVLLLGIFPRGWDEGQFKYMMPKIARINEAISKFADGDMVRYADFTKNLLEEDGTISRKIFKDGLHLSGEGYTRWADAMQPHIDEMLKAAESTPGPVTVETKTQ